MPRDLAEVLLTCQTQIIVCEANVGAYDLAKEIQALCPDSIQTAAYQLRLRMARQ